MRETETELKDEVSVSSIFFEVCCKAVFRTYTFFIQ
jgi:hypothetical protein